MKIKVLLQVVGLFFATNLAAQESFVYCSGADSIYIEQINETQSGDTLIKTYKQGLTTFNYYIYNDSIFSKHEGDYYLIGANSAQLGDVWNPLWYDYNSYNLTCAQERNLKVIGIEQVTIDGEQRNKYTLLIQDNVPYHAYEDSVLFHFIEGVGATTGGPFYNLYFQGACNLVFDAPYLTFKSYSVDDFTYMESECSGSDVGIEQANDSDIATFIKDGSLWINGVSHPFEVTIVDALGKTVLKDKNNTVLDVSMLKGLYFVLIQEQNQSIVIKTRIN